MGIPGCADGCPGTGSPSGLIIRPKITIAISYCCYSIGMPPVHAGQGWRSIGEVGRWVLLATKIAAVSSICPARETAIRPAPPGA